jgi:hypothetical protein
LFRYSGNPIGAYAPLDPPGEEPRCIMDTDVALSAPAPPRASRPSRARMVKLRVSAEEYATLETKAQEAGITLSALLRDHVGKVHIRDRDTERRRAALLNRLNANLNMIAKWANTHKGAADAVSVMAHIVALEAEITRLLEAQERA